MIKSPTKMKHLTLLILLAIAPLSWGEDVWYCVEEHNSGIRKDRETGNLKTTRHKLQKFTFKYESDKSRLAFKGKTWADSGIYYMPCDVCMTNEVALFAANDGTVAFRLDDDKFFVSVSAYASVTIQAGTCTKF